MPKGPAPKCRWSKVILKSPLIDAGTGEVIEAADEAVLSQQGQAEVLLRLEVVAGPVESLIEQICSEAERRGTQSRRDPMSMVVLAAEGLTR